MLNFKSIKHTLRYNDWWNFIVPPLLGFIYLSFLLNQIDFQHSANDLIMFFICIIGTAGFGYFLNDITDIEFDLKAGKRNYSAGISVNKRIFIIVLLLLIAFFPWMFLPLNNLNFGLFVFQLFLLVCYSVKPLRLKNFIFPGAFADSLYSGTVFILIILSTYFTQSGIESTYFLWIFVLSFLWALLKGFRNILLHQLSDRKNDRKSGLKTFALQHKPLKTLYLINFIILPFEIGFFIAFLVIISFIIHGYYLWYIVFLLFTLVKFSFWKIPKLPYRQRLFKFLYFMNDYYEEWMPVITLIYLSSKNFYFLIFLILHLIIFYRGIMKLYFDLKGIIYLKPFNSLKK
jgi:4-hydroxybenzoate polyprenyltransferase